MLFLLSCFVYLDPCNPKWSPPCAWHSSRTCKYDPPSHSTSPHPQEGRGWITPPLFRLHMGTFHWMGVGGCSCYLRPFGDDLLVLWRVVNLMWQWQVLPWKINNMEPKKIHPWKRQLIFQFSIFRFHINLPGWTFVSFVGFRLHRNQGQTVSSTSTAETGTSHWASERRSLFKWYCYLQDAVLIDLWYCF